MTVPFQEPPIHISIEQLSKLEIVKYCTANQVIKSLTAMQKDFLGFHEEHKKLYCIYLNLKLTKKSERKRKVVNFSKRSLFRNKLLCKKAWIFLTTYEFKTDEMPPSVLL